MNRRIAIGTVALLAVLLVAGWAVPASDAQMYFSSDKYGQNRVTNIQEGDEIWIAVHDSDENLDCDVRDKIWTEVKLFDPKTGAYLVWRSCEDGTGSPVGEDFDSVSVDVYDLTGTLLWSAKLTAVTEIVWDGTDATGASLANGTYIYVIYATDGTNSFTDKGKVFVHR